LNFVIIAFGRYKIDHLRSYLVLNFSFDKILTKFFIHLKLIDSDHSRSVYSCGNR